MFVLNLDTKQLTRLTDGLSSPESDADPSWSRDGKQIAFTSTRATNEWEIFTMKADGTAVTRLTNNTREDRSPAWNR